MSAFDEKRLALVKARLGRPGSEEDVATGYFLTANLVLTTGHVGDRTSTFRVRCEAGGPTEKDRWADAESVWLGAGDVDAMLLRTATSFGDGWTCPDLRPDLDQGDWRTSGYAAAAVNNRGERKIEPLDGDFRKAGGQGAAKLALTTRTNIHAGLKQYWRGLSGTPVFASGSDAGLIGVITDASTVFSNRLDALPVSQLMSDVGFSALAQASPSFLTTLPQDPFCAVLTREGGSPQLLEKVAEVVEALNDDSGEYAASFPSIHTSLVEINVTEAIGSVGNWAATVRALALADFLIADVTAFQPAVMLLLGVRSVLRRGVTVSVTQDDLSAVTLPFNVQETRVLSFAAEDLYNDLQTALVEAVETLRTDPGYLDLPAYHAVRVPKPDSWAKNDHKSLLLLCPYGDGYPDLFDEKLAKLIQAGAGHRQPTRMLDLRSPRLVGQALYEQIRWSTACVVDWTHWRPNVFFELGVRLACSDRDPLSIIEADDLRSADPPDQHTQLVALLRPVPYHTETARADLKAPMVAWRQRLGRIGPATELAVDRATDALPPAATFDAAQRSFHWQAEALPERPDREQRRKAERILGRDSQREQEETILFAGNPRFRAELVAAARENWVAAWLYLHHRVTAGIAPDALRRNARRVAVMVRAELDDSDEPRHRTLRAQIDAFLEEDGAGHV